MVRPRSFATWIVGAAALASSPVARAQVPAPPWAAPATIGPPHDVQVDPRIVPLPVGPGGRRRTRSPGEASARPAGVEQLGEIVILEGDDEIVSDDGSGGFSVVYTESRQDPPAITRRFFTAYPDEFDEIALFTTFPDSGSPGALAYEISTQQDTSGLGLRPEKPAIWDETAAWGSTRKRLYAFLNMKGVDDYTKLDGLPLDDPRSLFYPVMAQEFAHRWLAFATYRDALGLLSTRLLGRDGTHWSPTLQSWGSVMDGNEWRELDDGTFACVARMKRYAPLDLYLMGLIPPAEVPPFFVINGARTDGGRVLDPARDWYTCEHVSGVREDITIEQVIAALGPRSPGHPDAPRDFRVAFVLLTRPGERAGDVVEAAERLERVRRRWDEKFVEYTAGRGAVCTQASAPCGAAVTRIVSGQVVEAGGDGDGVIEPGEPVTARFRLLNDGPVDATNVHIRAEATDIAFTEGTTTIPRLAAGGTAQVALEGRFTDDRTRCDTTVRVRATAKVDAAEFYGFADVTPGAFRAVHVDFDAGAGGWGVNLEGKDTAKANTWAWGVPASYAWRGYFTFQPASGAGGTGACFFTGLARGDITNGVTTGLEEGRATLYSPPLDLRAAARPRIRYRAWFEAIDRSNPDRLIVSPRSFLRLDAANSLSSGRWWKLDEIGGADDRWRPRDVDPENPENGEAGLRLDRPVFLRFTVERGGKEDLVEAGVDEIEIIGDADGCQPPAPPPPTPPPDEHASGCHLTTAPHPAGPTLALLLVIVASARLLRRRR